MTPQLRQAISLLQMNNLELGELVAKELESNPLLEKEDDHLDELDSHQQTIDDYDTPSEPEEEQFAEDIDYENAFDDSGSDREGYEPSWQDRSTSHTGSDDEFDYLEQKVSARESVYDLLTRQIDSHFTNAKERLIASHLAAFLDRAGYFTGNLKELSQKLKISENTLQKILSTMQTFEPSGIFATSLKECLAIQLADINRLDDMMKIFLEHLPALAEKNFALLKKVCHADDEDLETLGSQLAQVCHMNGRTRSVKAYANRALACIEHRNLVTYHPIGRRVQHVRKKSHCGAPLKSRTLCESRASIASGAQRTYVTHSSSSGYGSHIRQTQLGERAAIP